MIAPGAPTTIVFPEIATASPNSSPLASDAEEVRLAVALTVPFHPPPGSENTSTRPCLLPPPVVSASGPPATTVEPEMATE